MPITELVIEQVEQMAVKDGATKGFSFKNRKGIEYEFDNDEEYEMMVEPEEPAPYPDIPAKALGMLTEREEGAGGNGANRQRASNVGSGKLGTRFLICAYKSDGWRK